MRRETIQSLDRKAARLKNEIKCIEERKQRMEQGTTTIGDRLQLKISTNGLTIKELAERIGIARVTLSNYCNDKRKIPHDILGRIAKELRTTCDYLIFGQENTSD